MRFSTIESHNNSVIDIGRHETTNRFGQFAPSISLPYLKETIEIPLLLKLHLSILLITKKDVVKYFHGGNIDNIEFSSVKGQNQRG